MAIHIPIRVVEQDELTAILEFSVAYKTGYEVAGKVGVDFVSAEIILLEIYTTNAENMFHCAKTAIAEHISNGKFPEEFARSS